MKRMSTRAELKHLRETMRADQERIEELVKMLGRGKKMPAIGSKWTVRKDETNWMWHSRITRVYVYVGQGTNELGQTLMFFQTTIDGKPYFKAISTGCFNETFQKARR